MRLTTLILMLIIQCQLLATKNPYEQLPAQVKDTLKNASTMIDLEGEPSALINGNVNAITGDFCDTDVDIEIAGAIPLIMSRSYTSSDIRLPKSCTGPLGSAWHFNHHGKLVIVSDHTVTGKTYATHEEGYGVSTYYEAPYVKSKNLQKLTLSTELIKKGMTNAGGKEISARSNRKNSHAYCQTLQPYSQMHMSDGTIRHFALNAKVITKYDLVLEQHPDGTQFTYGYDPECRLTKIKAQNGAGTTLSQLWFSYPSEKKFKENPHMNIHSSDGRKFRYDFIKKGDHYLLSKVTRPTAPEVSYEYVKTAAEQNDEYRISKKQMADNRFLSIDYYQQGSNNVGGHKVKISSLSDWRLNRVSQLKAPTGPQGEANTLYTFQYHEEKRGPQSRKVTVVKDALGGKSNYYCDKYNRLNEIIHFIDENQFTSDRLYWGADNTPNAGNLVSRAFSENGKTLCCRYNRYDNSGNIIEKQLCGIITGTNQITPQLNVDGTPLANGVDIYQQLFTYNEKNLKVVEENNRNKTLYAYKQGTDLISCKYLCDLEGNIKLRQFYEYDINCVKILEITDDGSSLDKNDLTNVTERHILRIQPRNLPPYGLSEEITQYYLDFATGQEIQNGKKINQHDPLGRLIRQDHYDNNNQRTITLKWEYDACGNLIAETNPQGYTIQRKFDANGNKIYEKNPINETESHFTYDFANRHVATTTTLADGTTISERNYYDLMGRKIAFEDNNGQRTQFQYDRLNRLIETNHTPTISTKVQYNGLNQPITIQDANGHALHISYNIHGKPIQLSYPDGTEERFEYSLDGLLLKHTASNGTTIENQYDYQGRMVKQTIHGHDGTDQEQQWSYNTFHLVSETGATGITTHYTHDQAGRLIQVTRQELVTHFEYDEQNRKYKTIENYGQDQIITIQKFDELNRIIEEKREDQEGTLLNRVWYTYDPAGNKTQIKVDTGSTIAIEQFRYDSLGTCVSHVDAEGYETLTQIDHHYQNQQGQSVKRIQKISPNGTQQEIIYDPFGRIATINLIDPLGNLLKTEESHYDPVGNRIQLIETINQAKQIVTQWEYDWFGRITAKIDAVGQPEQKRVTLSYYPKGEKAKLTKADGVEINYQHDGLGRLIQVQSTDIHYQYTYNQIGQLIEVKDLITNTTTTRTYNDHGHLASETLANGKQITYTTDPRGRCLQITLPDQSTITYDYKLDKIHQIHRNDYTHTYEKFDLRGNLLQETGLAGTTHRTYDIKGRLISITNPNWSETIDQFDSMGNLIQLTIQDKVKNYNYDAQNQLTQEPDHTYSWDAQHNRTTKDGQSAQHNALNQLTQDNSGTYTYDLNGNLTQFGDLTLTYDALDRLIAVDTTNEHYSYTYDSFNRRISKSGSTNEQYLYIADNEIGAATSEGTQLRILGIGMGAEIGAAIAIELDNTPYGVIHDHAGNISCLTADEPITYSYTAFGEETSNNTLSNPWRFSSKRNDPETTFYNFGRRYYIPTLSRWLTPDPIDRAGGPNIYAYVTNNPLTHIDSYGFWGFNLNRDSNQSDKSPATEKKPERTFHQTTVGKILSAPGNALKAVAHHCIPVRSLRNFAKSVCHVFAFKPLSTFKAEKSQKPRTYHVIGWESPISVNFVNGFNNTPEMADHSCHKLSDYLGGVRVDGVYNPTEGTFGDGIDYVKELLHIDTPTVLAVREHMRNQVKNNKYAIFIGASEGSELLYQGGRGLTQEERSRIIAISVGGARIFLDGDFGQVVNLVSTRDVIPFINLLRMPQAIKQGNCQLLESQGNYFIDHAFTDPTYEGGLKAYGKQYLDQISETMR